MKFNGLDLFWICLFVLAGAQIVIIFLMRKILQVLRSFQPPQEPEKPQFDNLTFKDMR